MTSIATLNDDKLDRCPSCGAQNSFIIDGNTGEQICGKCGVVDTRIATAVENRVLYSKTKDNTTVAERITGDSNSELFVNHGVFSYVGPRNQDAYGNKIDEVSFHRLKFAEKLVLGRTGKARAVHRVRSLIQNVCDKLNLNDVVAESIGKTFQKYYDDKITKGRSLDVVVAVIAYIVCKDMNIVRVESDFLDKLQLNRKAFRSAYALMHQHITSLRDGDSEIAKDGAGSVQLKTFTVGDMIPMICNKLGTSEKCKRKALELWDKMKMIPEVSGRHPSALAAAVIYAAGLATEPPGRFVQVQVSEAAGITEVSLRNSFKKFRYVLCDSNQSSTSES